MTPARSAATFAATLSTMKLTGLLSLTVACAAAVVAASAAGVKTPNLAKLPPAAAKQGVLFDKDIKPIFEKSCVKCHGPEKQKGDLRLESREATLKGSEYGKVVEAGKIDKSPLLWSVARLDEDTAMPPEGKDEPLTKEQVSLIRAWIEQGAK